MSQALELFDSLYLPLPLGGIGEAVSGALADQADVRVHRLYVKELPRSGSPDALLDRYGISAKHIVAAVKTFK